MKRFKTISVKRKEGKERFAEVDGVGVDDDVIEDKGACLLK